VLKWLATATALFAGTLQESRTGPGLACHFTGPDNCYWPLSRARLLISSRMVPSAWTVARRR
jgi:hypothetical protein